MFWWTRNPGKLCDPRQPCIGRDGVVLFGVYPIRDDDAEISWRAAFWDCGGMDKKHSVGASACWDVTWRVSLGEAGNFFNITLFPERAVGTAE